MCWSIVVKEKPTVGSPSFGVFPSGHIPKATKNFSVYFLFTVLHKLSSCNNSWKLYHRNPGARWSYCVLHCYLTYQRKIPLIFNLALDGRVWLASRSVFYTPMKYPISMSLRLGGPQRQCGRFRDEINLPCWELKNCSSVVRPIELSRLLPHSALGESYWCPQCGVTVCCWDSLLLSYMVA